MGLSCLLWILALTRKEGNKQFGRWGSQHSRSFAAGIMVPRMSAASPGVSCVSGPGSGIRHPTPALVPGLCCKVLLYLSGVPEESRAREGRDFQTAGCYCQKWKPFGCCSPCAQLADSSSKPSANVFWASGETAQNKRGDTEAFPLPWKELNH